MKRKNLHDEIVKNILPRFAEKLKAEGLISKHNRALFTIKLFKDWEAIRIRPDRLLHLQDGRRVLVEIVNPKDPKRFIGEIIYAHMLKHCNTIFGAVFFVLPHKHESIHKRMLGQHWALSDIMKTSSNSVTIKWSDSEDINYKNLKSQLSFLSERSEGK